MGIRKFYVDELGNSICSNGNRERNNFLQAGAEKTDS